jgi:hypothetical protein
MTNEQLKEANNLVELIKITKQGIDELRKYTPDDRKPQRICDDLMYNLYIGEYSDGSGKGAKLNRYYGNKKLMEVIINELERQLVEFEDIFKLL